MKTVFRFLRLAIRFTASFLLAALFLSVLFTGIPQQTEPLLECIPETPFFRYTRIGSCRGRLECLGITFGIDLGCIQELQDKLGKLQEYKENAVPQAVSDGIKEITGRITEALRLLFTKQTV